MASSRGPATWSWKTARGLAGPLVYSFAGIRGSPALPQARAAARWLRQNGPSLGTNALAGLIASLVVIAYCVSFSALLFQGELKAGLAQGLWALLTGSAIAGIYVSLKTSLPPAEAGPDNPAVAVLSVLAAAVSGQVFAAGGGAALAVDYVLLSFSLATLLTGLVLYLLGALKLGQAVRFIPYPVIGGFLAASGWFLLTGGVEVITGRDFALADVAGSVRRDEVFKVVLAVVFATGVFEVRRRSGSSLMLPVAFFGGALLLDVGLWLAGLMHGESGWFVSGSTALAAWVPLGTAFAAGVDWSIFLKASVELAAVAGVTVIALLLDVSGLEVARTKSADLDGEFRINGLANILAAPLGGIMGNLSMNGSRLLDESGGFARMSGVFASLVVALVVVTGIDLPRLVPTPVLAGLLMYLGLVVLVDVLLRSPAQRAWTDFALALAIMVAIVEAGYLVGVMLGFVGACLMFAFSYSRIAVIRRHLTRAEFASNVDRAAETARMLREAGDRIHLFWLSGFIFFGSSNGVFESIRDAIGADQKRGTRYAVLDFSEVSGFDTSALLSLIKLRNHCEAASVTLAFAGLSPGMRAALEHVQVFAPGHPHRSFAGRNEALQWCEEQVIQEWQATTGTTAAGDFEAWLAAELGGSDKARALAGYFERRDIAEGRVLYEQGAPSDSIDLVVEGTVSVSVRGEPGLAVLVRRMSKRTVVGEMGFFRGTVRGATVTAEKGATIYTLSRDSYRRLLDENPELAAVFLEYIVRALSDRLEFANQGIAALS